MRRRDIEGGKRCWDKSELGEMQWRRKAEYEMLKGIWFILFDKSKSSLRTYDISYGFLNPGGG